MTTADTRIDYDRISDISLPSVTEAVNQSFGVGFFDANTYQKLLLVETLAFTLRQGGSFRENLLAVASGGCPVSLPDFSSTVALDNNEGLSLLALLHEAIVEDYSVAKHRQLCETIDDYAGEAVLDRFKDPEELNIDR
jgi:hypothetical protein